MNDITLINKFRQLSTDEKNIIIYLLKDMIKLKDSDNSK